jgi:MFS family permease
MNSPARPALSNVERRVVTALAAIYMTRMLGLFLLLPVLALYASGMRGATPTRIGFAMGVYGLTQALLQIPFGRWSDRYGRRPLIYIGLALFFVGSVMGALADSLAMLTLARAVQGAGAMSAAVTALIADSTREVIRTRAMAFIGISIGLSFIISLVTAPLLQALVGVAGIFWVMASMAVAGAGLLFFAVPRVEQVPQSLPSPCTGGRASRQGLASREEEEPGAGGAGDPPASLAAVAADPRVRAHYIGVFALHFILTSTFLSVPLLLAHDLGLREAEHWKVYLGVFIASLAGTVPMIFRAEKRGDSAKNLLLGAIVVAGASQLLLALNHRTMIGVMVVLAVFFAAFNFLEARLPALVSKAAPKAERGAALGVFATCQFLGAFFGGSLGGLLLASWGPAGVFSGSAAVALLWAVLTARLPL